MCRAVAAAEHVFDECILIHAVESAGIAEHNHLLVFIRWTLSDAVIDVQNLLPVKKKTGSVQYELVSGHLFTRFSPDSHSGKKRATSLTLR